MELSDLVSVIMPCYNSMKTIEEAVRSVIHQHHQNWELIIVNDASLDDSNIIIDRLSKEDIRVKVIHLKTNGGLPNARNSAIPLINGKWVTFLDSDDYWYPEKLSSQIAFHHKNKQYLISHTAFTTFVNDINEVKQAGSLSDLTDKKSGDLLRQLLWKNSIGVLTVMMDSNLFRNLNGFNSRLKTLEDNDLWIRVAVGGYEFGYINSPLAAYRISSGGISKTLGKYKRAYKVFLNLHQKLAIENGVQSLGIGNYYRYFGTEYFKLKNYKLAKLYFSKSASYLRYNWLNILNLVYLIILKVRGAK